MRNRRAVSEVVAVTLILAATTAVLGLALVMSNDQILSNKASASEAIDKAKQRVGELVALVHAEKDSSVMKITLFNYGKEDIGVNKVMVDGKQVTFTIKAPEGSDLEKIPSKNPCIIQINAVGSSVQVVTASGNLFEFVV